MSGIIQYNKKGHWLCHFASRRNIVSGIILMQCNFDEVKVSANRTQRKKSFFTLLRCSLSSTEGQSYNKSNTNFVLEDIEFILNGVKKNKSDIDTLLYYI